MFHIISHKNPNDSQQRELEQLAVQVLSENGTHIANENGERRKQLQEIIGYVSGLLFFIFILFVSLAQCLLLFVVCKNEHAIRAQGQKHEDPIVCSVCDINSTEFLCVAEYFGFGIFFSCRRTELLLSLLARCC